MSFFKTVTILAALALLGASAKATLEANVETPDSSNDHSS
jgi:hypothetical protein